MALENENRTNEAEATVTQGLEDQGDLVVVGGRLAEIQQNQALRTILDIGKHVGRVQSAQIVATCGQAIMVSQLRQLKEKHKEAGLSWGETCEIVGIARRTADRYLTLADDLGDEFFGHCGQLGLSVRTMDAARQLPEPVRQALASGQVVDMEAVSKEALTGVIRQLATEHAKEKLGLEEELKAGKKALDKAVGKHIEAAERVSVMEQEMEALKEGLSGDDKRDLDRMRQVESQTMAFLVSVKNTLEIKDRDPGFTARLFGFLSLLQNMADLTASALQARLDGPEAEMAYYQSEAGQAQEAMTRQDNEDNAHFDKRGAYPGV